jgi:mRNA interferase RelE/StbE
MTRPLRPAIQVIDYVRRLAPESRRAVRSALKELGHERGDIRALEGTLAGYYRLRIVSVRPGAT